MVAKPGEGEGCLHRALGPTTAAICGLIRSHSNPQERLLLPRVLLFIRQPVQNTRGRALLQGRCHQKKVKNGLHVVALYLINQYRHSTKKTLKYGNHG